MRKQFRASLLIIASLLMMTGCLKTAKDQEKLRVKVIGYLEQMAEIEKREGWPVAVAQKLSKIGRPAVPILLEVVGDTTRDPVVRRQAVGCFIQPKFAKHPQVVPAAIQMLKTSDDTGKKLAATILGNTGDKRAAEPLVELLQLDMKDKYVKIRTIQALGNIKDKRAVEPLINILSDKETRGVTIDALSKIGGNEAAEALITTLKKDKDEIIRGLSAQALGKLKDKKAIGPLIESLSDPHWGVREHSVKALGNIKNERAIEPLIKSLSDNNSFVRKAAAEALEKITDKNYEYKK